MAELKPCPHCNSAFITALDSDYEMVYGHTLVYKTTVQCRDCGAMIMRTSTDSAEHARKAAVEAWNRRAHMGTKYMEGK